MSWSPIRIKVPCCFSLIKLVFTQQIGITESWKNFDWKVTSRSFSPTLWISMPGLKLDQVAQDPEVWKPLVAEVPQPVWVLVPALSCSHGRAFVLHDQLPGCSLQLLSLALSLHVWGESGSVFFTVPVLAGNCSWVSSEPSPLQAAQTSALGWAPFC